MKTPKEFLRENLEPKFNYSTNEILKMMESYADHVVTHTYALKKKAILEFNPVGGNPYHHSWTKTDWLNSKEPTWPGKAEFVKRLRDRLGPEEFRKVMTEGEYKRIVGE